MLLVANAFPGFPSTWLAKMRGAEEVCRVSSWVSGMRVSCDTHSPEKEEVRFLKSCGDDEEDTDTDAAAEDEGEDAEDEL